MRKKSPEICILMDYFRDPWAGTESQVLKLIQGLKSRGIIVRFVVLRHSEYTSSGLFPVPVEVLGVKKIASIGSVFKLCRLGRLLSKARVDLVHIFFNDSSVLAPPILKMFGIPCLISRRDMGFWYTPAYRKVLPITGRFVDGVICNSKAVARVTQEVERLPDPKLHVIYNGYPDKEPDVMPSQFKKCNSKTVKVGIVANLRPIKRIADAIEAVALVRSEGVDIELHVVGAGDDRPFRNQASRLSIAPYCYFWGQQKQVDGFVMNFDIALLTSESEGFSNSIIEYMRNAKPVVCTNTGGNNEIVEHGVNGYLYPVGDIGRLAAILTEISQRPELCLRMGQAGQRKVFNTYSVDRMLDEHLALYQRVLGKRTKEKFRHAG